MRHAVSTFNGEGGKNMNKKLITMLVTFCFMLLLAPVSVMAATPTNAPIVIDVGGANVENENYKITDTGINIRKRDVNYELTGTTDKQINFWGSNNPNEVDQAFYLKLNNLVCNGGFIVQNSPVKMVVEVPKDTNNKLKRISANDLTIYGSGVLNTEGFTVTQKTSYMDSALHVTDTTINVNVARNSAEWNGKCVISGNAVLTYTGNGTYAPLQLGVKNRDTTHSVLLEDNAKLICLQDDPETPSEHSVSGLESFGAPITLKDNSYLEAEAKSSTGKYAGFGIISSSPMKVLGNSKVVAKGYDAALSVDNDLEINGGAIKVVSKESNGIYANNLKIENAQIEAEGYYPALFGNNALSISNSTINATSTGDIAIFTRGNLSIENSKVDANAPQDKKGIKARKTTTINQSWITTTGDESYDSINDSVLFNGNDGKVIGNVTVIGEETVSSEKTLILSEGTTLTIPDKAKFTNNGTVVVNGTIINNGQITCTNHSGGKATCIQKAVCELCNQEYGDLLEHNYSTKWMNNEEIHWQECTVCHNHKDESKHIFDDDKDTVCAVYMTNDFKYRIVRINCFDGRVSYVNSNALDDFNYTDISICNNRLYVIDSGNSRVQILDENFHTIRSIELDQLSDSQNNYYMDISISDDETLFLTNNCANEEESYVSLIGSNEKKQRSSESLYGFITCTDKTVYGVNTFVHWKDSHSFHASGGESYLYEITAHGKLKKVFAFPYKYCPTDFCIDGEDIYVLTCAWARLDHYKLDGTYVETLIEFEELSPESYLVRTEDGFWVSDATQGTPSIIASPNELGEFSIEDGHTKTLLSKRSRFIFSADKKPSNSNWS